MKINAGTIGLCGLMLAIAACSSKKDDKAKPTPDVKQPKDKTDGDQKPATKPADKPKGPQAPTAELLAAGVPRDITVEKTAGWAPSQWQFDEMSWYTFAAINNARPNGPVTTPAWEGWSNTSNYLNLVTEWSKAGAKPEAFPKFGERYYPEACIRYCAEKGIDCAKHSVIEQVGKINDAVFEADSHGLSANPVIAANGTFLRYEVFMNQDLYDFVSQQKLYDVDNVDAANVNATCGQAGGPVGVMTVKVAWMDTEGVDASNYYTSERLVFTSGGELKSGKDTCELKKMGMVGMHIGHKTLNQPNWTWATFEQVDNAPDCGPWQNKDGGTQQTQNFACPSPATVDTDKTKYNLFPRGCSDTTDGKCQICNTPPAPNGDKKTCSQGFCVDQPPAAQNGYSRICRQVPVTRDGAYKDAYAVNQIWQGVFASSVWSKYMLISTQWFNWWSTNKSAGAPPLPATCTDVAPIMDSVAQGERAHLIRQDFLPTVPYTGRKMKIHGQEQPLPLPFLANTSMESYERSNCMGCHSKSALTNSNYKGPDGKKAEPGKLPPQGSQKDGTPNTPKDAYYFADFMWWLSLEVPADGVK